MPFQALTRRHTTEVLSSKFSANEMLEIIFDVTDSVNLTSVVLFCVCVCVGILLERCSANNLELIVL